MVLVEARFCAGAVHLLGDAHRPISNSNQQGLVFVRLFMPVAIITRTLTLVSFDVLRLDAAVRRRPPPSATTTTTTTGIQTT